MKKLKSVAITEQRGRKSLKNVLNSIGKPVSNIATGIIFLSTIGLTFAFPGESIKVPKNSTLSELALQYKVTQQQLENRNKKNIINPDYIQAGQDLIIYNKGPVGLCQTAYDILKYVF